MAKILIADDEKELRETVKKILENQGYKAKTAESTTETRQLAEEWHPDLVLLDILIPGVDFKDLFDRLNQLNQVKILYLSVVDKRRAEEEGLLDLSDKIVGYIKKPFSLETLLTKVENALSQ